jgi:hypothetical protein
MAVLYLTAGNTVLERTDPIPLIESRVRRSVVSDVGLSAAGIATAEAHSGTS